MKLAQWTPIIALMASLLGGTAWAEYNALIEPPAGPLHAGQSVLFQVYFHNTGTQSDTIKAPERVVVTFTSDTGTFKATANAAASENDRRITIQPGQFGTIGYTVSIPETIIGAARVHIPILKTGATIVDIKSPSTATILTDDEAEKGPATPPPPTLEMLQTLYQPYIVNFAAYQPTYFLVGTDPEKSKFQVSFKYRFISPNSYLAKNQSWVTGFHLAYTQTSFWDLESASKPFEDTSYKPEFFFVSPNIQTGIDWMPGLFVQTGFQHESNGRGGNDSRSTNFVYLKPIVVMYDDDSRFGMLVSPKVWVYVENDDNTNADLKDYRGYFDLEMKFGFAESLVLGSHLWWAKEGGSVQLDLTYPLHRIFAGHLDLYLQVQYVNALAESLIDYRERTEAVRIGFAIVR